MLSFGAQEEHFIEILPLKKANAESIHSALVEYGREKNIQLGRHIGIGFGGAATFSGERLSPHVLFVHCHCHVLQLASVQAANATPGIKSVYTTLMTLWKFSHYSPKRAVIKGDSESTRSSKLKIVKPSDTRWLAHERCVEAVKASYSSIVLALENIYETSHEPGALGLFKSLSGNSTIAAMYLLDYILPQAAKLSRALQTKHQDLTLISSLVDATLNLLDDAILPSANWVL